MFGDDKESPINAFTGWRVANKLALVPVMRAGNAMLDPLLELFPSASVYHLGLYRDKVCFLSPEP